jgi:hypothetical protein
MLAFEKSYSIAEPLAWVEGSGRCGSAGFRLTNTPGDPAPNGDLRPAEFLKNTPKPVSGTKHIFRYVSRQASHEIRQYLSISC